jgi:hypothetical protein
MVTVFWRRRMKKKKKRRRKKEEECNYQTCGVISQKTVIFVVIALRTSQIHYMENV